MIDGVYVTFHIQKDGRIYLGTAGHRNRQCSALKGREAVSVEGELAGMLPPCKKCSFDVAAVVWHSKKIMDA